MSTWNQPDQTRYYEGQIANTPGLGNVSSYQVSGAPFVTGSAAFGGPTKHQQIAFPTVTQSITLVPGDNSQLNFLAFAPTGSSSPKTISGEHYVPFPNSAVGEPAITLNVKCKNVWIITANPGQPWKLVASLTGIGRGQMYNLTGSGITD